MKDGLSPRPDPGGDGGRPGEAEAVEIWRDHEFALRRSEAAVTTTTSPPATMATMTRVSSITSRTPRTAATLSDRWPGMLWWIVVGILLAVLIGILLRVSSTRSKPRRQGPTSGKFKLPLRDRAQRPGTPHERRPPLRAAREVSTGFSSASDPGRPLDPDTTLEVSSDLCFWFEVGPPVPESIETMPRQLPRPPTPALGAELSVTLSPLGRGEGIEVANDIGMIAVLGSGEVVMRSQPQPREVISKLDPELLRHRLLFGVRTPKAPGIYRLRCGVHRRQTLIQSRVITVEVTTSPKRAKGALVSEVDYTLSARLDAGHLEDLPSHTLSILLNRSDDQTHDLLMVGQGFSTRVVLDALALQTLVSVARGGLRLAAWGDDEEWSLGKGYLYRAPTRERLRMDLVRMAQRGMALYTTVVQGLEGGRRVIETLEKDLSRPGSLQIALGHSARRILPASLVYDYRGLETQLPLDRYELCATFVRSLDAGESLEDATCFARACPSRGEELVVCPSGFWGYRHQLGFPVSEEGREARSAIGYRRSPTITMAVSTDVNLVERPEHELTMRELWGRGAWNHAASRKDTLRALREIPAHVVYLYCHGGLTPIGEPFVQVGPTTEPGITASVLLNEDVFWEETRPLVFINGCHTTAVEPEKAFELVSPLVATSGAAGVIGTEITVFETLARAFAEAYFRRFVAGQSLGAALRGARLELLAAGNPLGLAYIPFGLPGLRLQKTTGPWSDVQVERVP